MTTRSAMIQEAVSICDECRAAGAEVRIFGGVAAAISAKDWFDNHQQYSRTPGDIDLVGRKDDLKTFRSVLDRRGYDEAKQVGLQTEGERALFGRDDVSIDFAGDQLPFCQRLEVRARLRLDYPTLSVTDLILEKLQIIEPARSQFIDFAALLGSKKAESFEMNYLTRVLGHNWGFWHSARMFLQQARRFALIEGLTDTTKQIDVLQSVIEQLPKSLRWRARAVFGELLPWHAMVEPLSAYQKQVRPGQA